MKKPIVGAVVAIAAIAALRRFRPDLERAMAQCHQMMSAPAAAPCCAPASAAE